MATKPATTRTEQHPTYRALVDLTYATSAEAIARIQQGERVPFEERALKTVAAGEIAVDVPAASVPWLLEQGLIEVVTDA